MNSSTGPVIFMLVMSFILTTATSQSSNTCSETFSLIYSQRNLSNCKKLTTLGAEFGWNYSDMHGLTRIDILFGAILHTELGWLAWGVNPDNMAQMVGTRAIIGIRQANASLDVNTYNITADTKLGCRLQPSEIDVTVKNMHIEQMNRYVTLSATLFLPNRVYNISKLNHVWQVGYDVVDLEPKMHPATLQNVDSTETLNLKNYESHGVGVHRRHLRMVHGILNIVGWGVLLPAGVIIARYCRRHPLKLSLWYALHVGCQSVGYTLGSSGWIVGLWLGKASTHYSFRTHRMLAIFIFTFTTLQMLALRFRPKPKDEYRKFWNMYHHFLGYALLAVISVNIFHGIGILKPDNLSWRWAYIGILGLLGIITLCFEIFGWIKFLRKNKKEKLNDDAKTQRQKVPETAQDPSTSSQPGGGQPGGGQPGGGQPGGGQP